MLIPMSLSRREFSRLAALGLAARFARPLSAQAAATPPAGSMNAAAPADRKIGYAVIGLGRIAGHFMQGARNTSNSATSALVSGHRDKAEKIAAEYGIPQSSIYSYENFD